MPLITFSAGIHIAVKSHGRFLILRKSATDKDDANHWDLPGGGLNLGEQPFEAARREAKEEAGIKIDVTKILTVWAMPYRDKWSIEFLVEGKYLKGEVKLSSEHSEYRWVNKQELKSVKHKGLFVQKLADLV